MSTSSSMKRSTFSWPSQRTTSEGTSFTTDRAKRAGCSRPARAASRTPRRPVVHADRVPAQAADLAEVGLQLMLNREGDAAGLRLEGSVGHSLDPELLVAETEELPVERDPRGLRRGCTDWGSILPQGVHPRLQLPGLRPRIPTHPPSKHTHEVPPNQSLVPATPSGRPDHARSLSAQCRGDVMIHGKSAAKPRFGTPL